MVAVVVEIVVGSFYGVGGSCSCSINFSNSSVQLAAVVVVMINSWGRN